MRLHKRFLLMHLNMGGQSFVTGIWNVDEPRPLKRANYLHQVVEIRCLIQPRLLQLRQLLETVLRGCQSSTLMILVKSI